MKKIEGNGSDPKFRGGTTSGGDVRQATAASAAPNGGLGFLKLKCACTDEEARIAFVVKL